LGNWDSAARHHDALETVRAQNSARVPELVPIRMSRMAVSPWSYYRGAAAVMAADLGGAAHSGLDVQLCGDAHVLNFGLWATPERRMSFDLRDFDETLRGPFEWDVKRFLASLVVIARECGLTEATAAAAVKRALRAYRASIARYASAGELDIWYETVSPRELFGVFASEERERALVRVRKQGAKRSNVGTARKLTHRVDGQLRILADPPVRVRLDDRLRREGAIAATAQIVQAYHDSLPPERQHLLDRFTFRDAVRQVVGVGSVGMQVYLVLLEGRLGHDPLFLQVKQAGPSVYEPYLGASPSSNHGQRVVTGKRLIQAASDIFLGWTTAEGSDYYVRQFRDMKVIPNEQFIAPHLVPFAQQCAVILARAHARTGDAAAIAGYVGKGARFDRALRAFAHSYADQTLTDHRQLKRASADRGTT
jgi:uncharacterized protein (DUF2252 family)